MSKPIIFNRDEIPLCPNGHGQMYLDIQPLDDYLDMHGVVREARAFCLTCRHTMIVADERPATTSIFISNFPTPETPYYNDGVYRSRADKNIQYAELYNVDADTLAEAKYLAGYSPDEYI